MLKFLLLAGAWACAANIAVAAEHDSRTLDNYRRLMAGLITWESLGPREQEALRELARLIRAQTVPTQSEAERCWRTEIDRNRGNSSDLALRLIELKCGPRRR